MPLQPYLVVSTDMVIYYRDGLRRLQRARYPDYTDYLPIHALAVAYLLPFSPEPGLPTAAIPPPYWVIVAGETTGHRVDTPFCYLLWSLAFVTFWLEHTWVG